MHEPQKTANPETDSTDENTGDYRQKLGYATLLLPLALYGVVLIRTAWLNDDAYITFRTVENFVTGYGLTWNPAERVQAFTHPLWMFLMSAAYFLTREMYLTPIFVSIAVSAAAFALLLLGVARTSALAWVAAAVLISSRAFVDYSTSGLENPLTHLLLALFLLVYFSQKVSPRILCLLCFIAALGMLNRLDTALFYFPALLYAWWNVRSIRATVLGFLGGLPILLWEIFSVVYYGFPFPNTAYAKLGTGISDSEMARQGLRFFEYTLAHDPLTLAFIVLALAITLIRRDAKALFVALGVLLYLAYIVKVGGDFMGGRFFTAPLFVAAALLVQWRVPDKPHWWAPVIIALFAVGFAHPFPTIKSDDTFGQSTAGFKDASGIGDERRFYYQHAGLLKYQRGKAMPTHSFAQTGRGYRNSGQAMVKKHGSVGYRGFFGGPKVHIVDYYALTDPLLARMPAMYAPNWRIGHFSRTTPPGYLEASGAGKAELLRDPKLREYYEHLLVITRGPIWSADRWKRIWNMNTGKYDGLVAWDTWRFPDMQKITLNQLGNAKQQSNKAPTQPINLRGLHVDFEELKHFETIEISLGANDQYKLLFMNNDTVLAEMDAPMPQGKGQGLATLQVEVPATVSKEGCTAVRIFPHAGDKRYSIGHLLPK